MVRQADIDEANKEENRIKDKGMKWDRSCTDVIFCLVFFVFLVVMIALSAYGLRMGDPMKIITPFDSVGNRCGATGQGIEANPVNVTDLTSKPYKYFSALRPGVNVDASKIFNAVCVASCPKQGEATDCFKNSHVSECPTAAFDTVVAGTYCLPEADDVKQIFEKIYNNMNEKNNFGKYMADIAQCWQAIAGMCAATLVISVIYIFLLKWITKPLLYVSMLLILVFFILLGGWSWIQRTKYDPVTEEKNFQYATIGAYVSWAVAVLYLLFMCCCWSNISLGASIMETASDFVTQNLRIVALPLMSYLCVIVFFIYWIYTAVYLYSIGEPEFEKNSPVANIKWDDRQWGIMWYFLFALFWCVAFLICLQQFVIAAMCCMWYFSGQGSEMSDQPGSVSMITAFTWGAWYHCGSLALGSFLIAVITMIRVVFEYLVKKYESVGNKDNALYKAVTCCIRCVLWCLDKYVKFITKNAYIQIALHNNNFCMSAWTSFFLMIRHAGRFSSAVVVGWIMMMLGKGTIMASSAYLTILVVQTKFPEVQQPFIPAAIVLTVAYVVGSLFLSIFSFSCTAILHCFLMDEDTGGSANTPDSLRSFLDYNDEQNTKKTNAVE